MATKILFAPKQSDAVLEIARSLTPAGFELLIADFGTPGVLRGGRRRPSTTWASPARWAASSSAPRPNLKLVQLLCAGYDRVDIEAARKAKVPVSNNGGANAIAVAEHTIMLMLAVLKRVVRFHNDVVAGKWRVGGFDDQRVYELSGKHARHRGARQHRQEGRAARGRLRHDGAVLRHRAASPRTRRTRSASASSLLHRAAAHLRRGEPARAARRLHAPHAWARASSP